MRTGFILALLIILFPLVSGLSLDMKESYQASETVIAQIKGIVLEPISPEQLEIKRVNVRVPVEYDIKRVGEDYFIWFITPSQQGNYSIIIKDVVSDYLGQETKKDVSSNFSVENTSVKYYLSPGFLLNEKENVTIMLLQDESMSINVEDAKKRSVVLQPGKNNILIDTERFSGSSPRVNIGQYSLPFYLSSIISDGSSTSNGLILKPSIISEIISPGISKNFSISLKNELGKTLEILLEENESWLEIVPASVKLKANESTNISVRVTGSRKNNVMGIIKAETDNASASARFFIDVPVRNVSINKTNYTIENDSLEEYTCEEKAGRFCGSGESCEGKVYEAIDGSCCLGTCKEPVKPSPKWLGWLLAALAICILVYVFYIYKKNKPAENPLTKKVNEIEKKIP